MKRLLVCLLLVGVVGCGSSKKGSTGQTQAQAEFEKGLLLLNREDWDTSIICFTEAIRLNPDCVEAYMGRGTAYFERGWSLSFPVLSRSFESKDQEHLAAAAQATAPPPSSDPFSTLGEQATRAWKRAYGPLSPAGLRPPPADFDRETNMQSMFDIRRRAFARPRASATQGPPSGVAEGWSAVDRNSREYQRAYQTFISRNLSPDQADVEAQAQVLNAAHRGAPQNPGPYSATTITILKLRHDAEQERMQRRDAAGLDEGENASDQQEALENAASTVADFNKANDDFTHVIRLDVNSAEAYLRRGLVVRYLGDDRKSQADFKRAKELGFDP